VPVYDLAPELHPGLMVLQLRAQWDVIFTGRGESSWSFVMPESDPHLRKEEVAALWIDNVKGYWMSRRPPEWHFTRILVEDRYPATTVPLEIAIDEYGPPGEFNGAPVQLSPIVVWNTALHGRSYRGRTFWGQMRTEDLEGSNMNAEMFTALNDFGQVMFDTFCVGSVVFPSPTLSIVSRQHNNAPEPIGRYAFVRQWQTPRYLATQRRRNRYYQS
jgi:hypothetical protein